MGIFRRNRSDADPTPELETDELDGSEDEVSPGSADGADSAHSQPADEDAAVETFNRTRGPFDSSEVEASDDDDRIDLGALRIPPVDGMQLRLELDQEQQNVVSAHALLGASGVQLQVFAAPRTLGVWPDIRSEIATSVTSQGGTAEVVDGPLGRELVTRIPSRSQDGRTVHNPVRFLGVDGPRWFLRGVISGPAATDDRAAAPLIDLVRATVVVRDDQARPPREALPLHVPVQPEAPATEGAEALEAAEADGPVAGQDDDEAPRVDESARPDRGTTDDLKPFERGPEITEVR